MAMIRWDANLSVGISQIDNEHRKLVDMVNSLHQGVNSGTGKEALGAILNTLISYTKTHFDAEERLMKQHAYPDYLQHKKEHTRLMLDVGEVVKLYQTGTATLPNNVLQFLVDWLTNHIKAEDKKTGQYLRSKGLI